MTAKQPRPASHFKLNLGGREKAALFREVSGLSTEMQVVETQKGGANGLNHIVKIPGAQKAANITLKRGADPNRALYEWYSKVRDKGPNGNRIDGVIELCDYQGKTIHAYAFKQGFPVKYDGVTLNSSGSEMAVETLTIAHEGVQLI